MPNGMSKLSLLGIPGAALLYVAICVAPPGWDLAAYIAAMGLTLTAVVAAWKSAGNTGEDG